MASAAVELLAQVLRDFGPPILTTPFLHNGTSELRLQLAPDSLHNSEHDPHKEGRALDIVLLASHPGERAEADDLVRLFRRLVADMQWAWLIYNQKQWSPSGAETPRIFRAKRSDESAAAYALDKMRFEHVTHIHIEWELHKRDFDGFEDALSSALSDELDSIAELDALPAKLDGTWNVKIGDWAGFFKFTESGNVTWHSTRGGTAGGTGRWNVDTLGKLRWKFGGGDIRIFQADLPIEPQSVSGQILPSGQGWFTMSKTT